MPLARNSFQPGEIATVTPEREKYCRDLFAREGGALTGGTNWGGGAYDPKLGYIFVDTKSLANFSKLVPRADGRGYTLVGPGHPPARLGDYFWDGP